jgi:hypothetical protein
MSWFHVVGWLGALCSDNMEPRTFAGAWFLFNPNLNIPIQGVCKMDQAFYGESADPPVSERRDLSLVRP